MKNILLITIASLVIIEANGGWPHYGRGSIRNERGNQGPAWSYPQQMNQINFGPDVEWVCQNPKTNDMIIATDNTQRQHPGRGPWWQWQNVPPGHHNHHHQNPGNYWTQPVIVVQQEPTRTDGNELSFTTPPPTPETYGNNDSNNNDNNQPLTTPNYHGGEGLIDIRVGD